jgi:hypothetical protein
LKGYLYLWRKLADSPMWLSEKFTRGQAWVDLLMLAQHKDTYFRIRGIRVDVKRGQLAWSQQRLADRWKWSRGKVRRFLSELESEKEGKIVQQNFKLISLITILNFDSHQTRGTTNGHQTDSKRTLNSTGTSNVKNVKKKELEIPDWLNKELWKEFKKHRTSIKSPLTLHAEKLCLADHTKLVNAGENQDDVINATIKSGKWKSFYKVKYQSNISRKPLVNVLKCPECGCDWSNVVRGEPCPQCHGVIPMTENKVKQFIQGIGA